mmetsp:Transcript_1925/g.2835  ORF Transcript_1925/g.2835 Transcript_1925/m.2835 type:complete len:213 (+) Transcript_1925:97-735(+)
MSKEADSPQAARSVALLVLWKSRLSRPYKLNTKLSTKALSNYGTYSVPASNWHRPSGAALRSLHDRLQLQEPGVSRRSRWAGRCLPSPLVVIARRKGSHFGLPCREEHRRCCLCAPNTPRHRGARLESPHGRFGKRRTKACHRSCGMQGRHTHQLPAGSLRYPRGQSKRPCREACSRFGLDGPSQHQFSKASAQHLCAHHCTRCEARFRRSH